MSYLKPHYNYDNNNNSSNQLVNSTSPTNGSNKVELSKSVLSMKFMKRNDYEINNNKSNGNNISSNKVDSNGDKDHVDYTEDQNSKNQSNNTVIIGRRSFNGFNKAIERLYQQTIDDFKYNKIVNDNNADNMDEYDQLVSLPRGPNQGRLSNNKRRMNNDSNSNNKKTRVR